MRFFRNAKFETLDERMLLAADMFASPVAESVSDGAIIENGIEFDHDVVAGFASNLSGPRELPSPILELTGTEDYVTPGGEFTRYEFTVSNRDAFPNSLFEAAPHLPACGLNDNASRTWVDFHEADGSPIYGFCGLSDSDDLDGIWFATPRGEVPPHEVFVTLTDREDGVVYTSNTVDTLPSPILEVTGTEDYVTPGGEFTRYEFTISNRDAFPDGLFEACAALASLRVE